MRETRPPALTLPRALFATCPRGLEIPLAAELARLGVTDVRIASAGVHFRANLMQAWAVNLHSRLASRVLLWVAQGTYRNEDDLYKLARGIAWEHWFDPGMTLRVDVGAQRSPITSLNFVTLRIKDAIVDRFRDLSGRRPSINTRDPDVRVQTFLGPREATIYLDLSGESLFKRGWRGGEDDKGEAPLKENLAAGLIALAGWRPEWPLYDPFCGSGTVLIEAAQQALAIAPGQHRAFGFERLKTFDAIAWADLRREAAQAARERQATLQAGDWSLHIAGSDIDGRAIGRSQRNIQQAGLPADLIRTGVTDLAARNYLPPWKNLPEGPAAPHVRPRGMIIGNPPYGARMSAGHGAGPRGRGLGPVGGEASHAEVMAGCGLNLKKWFAGWSLHLISTDTELPDQLGLKAEPVSQNLFNGAMACRFYRFDLAEATPL